MVRYDPVSKIPEKPEEAKVKEFLPEDFLPLKRCRKSISDGVLLHRQLEKNMSADTKKNTTYELIREFLAGHEPLI